MSTEWKLNDYYYDSIDDPRIVADIDTYISKVDSFVGDFHGQDLRDDAVFLSHLERLNTLSVEADRVMNYFFYVTSLNSEDNQSNALHDKYQNIILKQDEKLLFLRDMYSNVLRFDGLMEMANDPMMHEYRNHIIKEANNIKYSLSPNEERVAMKMDSIISSGALDSFKGAMDFKLRRKSITESELRSMRLSMDRSIRKNAITAQAKEYLKPTSRVFFRERYAETCMHNVVNMELRRMGDNVMTSRNVSEQMSNESVNKLIEFVTSNFSIYHEFLSLKAKFLGIRNMGIHDVLTYVSRPQNKKKNVIKFEDGWKMYMDSIGDPMLKSFSEEMLNSGRVSVYPYHGKVGGAYANYKKFEDEFILLNWTGTMYDVVVLAHEMGHAFHGHLSKKQNALSYHTSLVIAETASIFNETLMFKSIIDSEPIKNSSDREEKGIRIMNRLDDIFGTTFRQIMYTNFEKECHESFRDNDHLSADDLDTIWMKNAKQFYGEAVNISPDLERFRWSSISHFFEVPFYCYTYSFGNLISLALISEYEKELDKSAFFKKYHDLLSSGGSKKPEDLLMDTFGISFNDEFFDSGLDHIKYLMSELRSIFS